MEEYRSLITLVMVAMYMVMCIGVGIWAMRRTKTAKDFFMAGRNLGIVVTGMAVFASTLSGFGFVGGPGLVYQMGLSSIWMVICVTIGYCLSFFLLAKRIRLFAELRDSISLPDAVAARYNSELSRFLTALAIILGVIGYLAAQINAMATVLQDILNNSPYFGEVSLELCVFISVSVLVFYCVTGGIIAAVYTDVVQGSVMIVAGVLVFFAAVSAFDGGATEAVATIMADDSEAIGPWGTRGIMACLCWYFVFGLGGAGQPHIITKMMMNKKVTDAKYILPISMGGFLVAALLWISIGLAMRALVISGVHEPLAIADLAAPQFLRTYAHPLLAGVVFAALFAAIMSTADGFLNIGAASAIHDIPKAFGMKPLKHELRWVRIGTVLLAALAASFALVSDDLVALLGAFGWGTFAAALVPAVAIGFNWKRATALAVNVAIISSLVINLSVKLFDMYMGRTIPYLMDGGALALIVSLTLFFGISLLSPPPKLDPDIEAVMDL